MSVSPVFFVNLKSTHIEEEPCRSNTYLTTVAGVFSLSLSRIFHPAPILKPVIKSFLPEPKMIVNFNRFYNCKAFGNIL